MLALRTMLFAFAVHAGTTGPGGSCSTNNDHLDPASHKFVSECTDQTFCSGAVNGSCVARNCRRDEFPFGFEPDESLPPQCVGETFCPDSGSGCRPLVYVGGVCELNRDEQCAPPLDWQDLADTQNFNGSICLHSMCMCVFVISIGAHVNPSIKCGRYANVTLGQPCIADNTTYVDFGLDGQQYTSTITRDNCKSPQFFCDLNGMVCQRTKFVGSACVSDSECTLVRLLYFISSDQRLTVYAQHNCGSAGICAEPPETPLRVAPWQYATTALCIIGGACQPPPLRPHSIP